MLNTRAARGRPRQQCPRRGQPEERREVARAEHARGQGALGAECPEARNAGSKARDAAGRGRRRLRGPRDDADPRARALWVPCRASSWGGSSAPPGGSSGRSAWPPERGWGPVPQPGGQAVELFERRYVAEVGVGLALIRDGNGTRPVETVLRYRGAAQAELLRCLRALKAPQAAPAATTPARAIEAEPRLRRAGLRALQRTSRAAAAPGGQPNEPKSRTKPRDPDRSNVRRPVPPAPEAAASRG
jgi:hypothetical protein